MRDFFLKEGYDYENTTAFFHVYVFYAPILINTEMASGNLPLLSRYPRKDLCSGNARN